MEGGEKGVNPARGNVNSCCFMSRLCVFYSAINHDLIRLLYGIVYIDSNLLRRRPLVEKEF